MQCVRRESEQSHYSLSIWTRNSLPLRWIFMYRNYNLLEYGRMESLVFQLGWWLCGTGIGIEWMGHDHGVADGAQFWIKAVERGSETPIATREDWRDCSLVLEVIGQYSITASHIEGLFWCYPPTVGLTVAFHGWLMMVLGGDICG